MSDLIEDDTQPGNAPEFSVSELSGVVKRVIEGEFAHVRVRGEVGRVSRPRSGHVYMDLKDDRAVLAGVIWKGVAARLATQPEEGMEVVATGRLTTFAGQSRYQLVIEQIAPAGVGALMAMLEKRKAALAAEGLFDPARKQDLPWLPGVIGVVTSPSGAVIRDILHRLRDRFPRQVLIWPVAVQGERCAPEVVNAIQGFNALPEGGPIPRPDLLIVARGGGSVEDLWGFNDEAVVRTAAASRIPLISAVGHETDTTLIDHAADRRAPTPTAAAELAVPVRAELMQALASLDERRVRAQVQTLSRRRQRLADLTARLPRAGDLLQPRAQELDFCATRLPVALQMGLSRRGTELARLTSRLRPGAGVAAAGTRLAALGPRLSAAMRVQFARRYDALATWRPARQAEMIAAHISRGRNDLIRTNIALTRAEAACLTTCRAGLEAVARLHQTLGYQATLARGYAVVRSGDRVVTSVQAASAERELDIEFSDGRMKVTPDGAQTENRGTRSEDPTPVRRKTRGQNPGDADSGQGSLF